VGAVVVGRAVLPIGHSRMVNDADAVHDSFKLVEVVGP
jgi:hypothetical protein